MIVIVSNSKLINQLHVEHFPLSLSLTFLSAHRTTFYNLNLMLTMNR